MNEYGYVLIKLYWTTQNLELDTVFTNRKVMFSFWFFSLFNVKTGKGLVISQPLRHILNDKKWSEVLYNTILIHFVQVSKHLGLKLSLLQILQIESCIQRMEAKILRVSVSIHEGTQHHSINVWFDLNHLYLCQGSFYLVYMNNERNN
jgi:hypothetical protein